MDRIQIIGGTPLYGDIPIGGAKNAALPLMAASMLTEEILEISNLPDLADISAMLNLLESHGVKIKLSGNTVSKDRLVSLDSSDIKNIRAEYDLVRKMRASVLVMGPLLARFGEACVSLPGGCAIGTRPINLHLSGLEKMGAIIEIENGYVYAKAPKGLSGNIIRFPTVSVGATENIMMAASLASGETIIENAAREPEIVDLAKCLSMMGAIIEGVGTSDIRISGQSSLSGGKHKVIPDRIEAATYAMAGAMTKGEVRLVGVDPSIMGSVLDAIKLIGAEITLTSESVVVRNSGPLRALDISTAPFPGFPTDAQAQIMALLTTSQGRSVVTETIFENRFMHVPELQRMGANILVQGSKAIVEGVEFLRGAQVMATDLRASVSLVLAGLIAKGETTVNRVYHLDRGYERLVEKLAFCGANIERITK